MQSIRASPLYQKCAYANTPDAHPGLAQDQTLAHLSHERSGRVQQTGQGWISGEN